jgi:hypothetical protein
LISQIDAAVEEMHTRGVVHVDLYLSDIMWKRIADGTYCVLAIDFDPVHELGIKPLTLNALQEAIRNGDVGGFSKLGMCAIEKHDTLYLDTRIC